MAPKPCIDCGTIATSTRCPRCEQMRQHQRNAARGDRYGAEHRSQRETWAPMVATGTVACARCGDLIDGFFDLDHLDDGTEWPSHPPCNRKAITR